MFGQLALVVAAGLLGPLLAAGRRPLLPVVVGELAAGAILGRTGFGVIQPTLQPFPAFSTLGFAMLMLTAGTHVDPGSPDFRSGAPRGLRALLAVAPVAVVLGVLLDAWAGLGHPALLAVLLAGSSAAIAFPIIEERRLKGPEIAILTAWIAIADSATVVLLPLTLVGPEKLPLALAGDAIVVATGVGLLWLAERGRRHPVVRELRRESRTRGWALQLRLAVLLLLALAAIADETGASTLVAGVVAGMILARLREPGRLARQLSGVASGFFVPIFFVLLGAGLDLRALAGDPAALGLGAVMAAGAVVVHLAGAFATGAERRLAPGLTASAQLGLPAAAAALGLSTGALSPSIAAAIVGAGCLTLIPASIGAALLTRDTAPTVVPAAAQ